MKPTDVISDLPSSLALEVMMHLCGEKIRNVPLFNGCDDAFVSALIQHISVEVKKKKRREKLKKTNHFFNVLLILFNHAQIYSGISCFYFFYFFLIFCDNFNIFVKKFLFFYFFFITMIIIIFAVYVKPHFTI